MGDAMKEWVRSAVRSWEEWRFDRLRGVKTAGSAPMPKAEDVVGEIRDSEIYLPVRTSNARAALSDLPMKDLSEYTFVDLGSGKGRMLFIAAEYPFRKVVGVEFSNLLHAQAETNLGMYKKRRQRCGSIESICADAAEFEFPEGKLVIYMFNPFGPEVMRRMLRNLERSLERTPRHVVVMMLWPENAELVANMAGMQTHVRTRRHHVYQTTG
jgi:SAM-dependent methyltransferase